MARGLKTNGLETLENLRKRVQRQYTLSRIAKADHDVLIEKLNEIEAHILAMNEFDPKFSSDWRGII